MSLTTILAWIVLEIMRSARQSMDGCFIRIPFADIMRASASLLNVPYLKRMCDMFDAEYQCNREGAKEDAKKMNSDVFLRVCLRALSAFAVLFLLIVSAGCERSIRIATW